MVLLAPGPSCLGSWPLKRVLVWLVLGLVILAAALLLWMCGLRGWAERRYRESIYTQVTDVPQRVAAIVFGAGYWPSGQLSDILADRLETAIALYEAGRVNKLLLTGDNRFVDYNEPARMAEYATSRGVYPADLVLDYAGRRTYDSCYRAKAIFGLDEAVLVTQTYHLPRALFTCDELGLDVIGLAADRRQYVYDRWYTLRELLALARAWLDVNVLKPLPVLGERIPIDWGDQPGDEKTN